MNLAFAEIGKGYLLTTVNKLINWHKSMLERAQKEMGLSNYTLYWMAFLEGALVMWLIMKVAIHL